MRLGIIGALAAAVWAIGLASMAGESSRPVNDTSTNVCQIDLTSALRLAGARNLDVQIARQRVAEARANYSAALAQFFPWLAPGLTYRQHDGKLQDVEGNILDVHKNSYAPGATVAAQVDIGDALYKTLASKQLASAVTHALEAQRQTSVFAAAQGYFELALAANAVNVARESVSISMDYHRQLEEAVKAGIAFKGDLLRVRVELERNQLALRQAAEQQRFAAARLAQVLHLDPAIDLAPRETDLAPMAITDASTNLHSLVQAAMATRPELKQNQSLIAAASDAQTGAIYGPLVPSIGAQAFFGGLGGGRRGISDTFGEQEDYILGLSWRIGPGGLFDFTRSRAAEARLKIARLDGEKVSDAITREVVEAFTHWQSSADQIETSRRALAAGEEGLRLAQQRKEFAVGIVLENIQAEQDLTRARLDYLRAVAEFNKAQYALSRAVGKL
jgi:outer membrane protein TolC